jgi:NAD(P)-dependent dehydrogenase (short-subunit alcohol dehydrogenase family)
MELSGKTVLITGGSHGLGLAMARGFAGRGARVAICGRDEESLASAKRDLESRGAEVLTIRCDVADRKQVESAVAQTIALYGALDVLVNNAGVIQAQPLDATSIEDFEQAMNVMFWGSVYATFAALPHLRSRPESRIVNITSIGGKVAVPHLLPYTCAKFAAAAFSEGLRAELSSTPVKVVTIAPGLMRTGGHYNARFKGDPEAESAWFSAGASLPGISMSAARAARQVIAATRTGCAEKTLGAPATFIARLNGMFPGFTSDLMGFVNRLLPQAPAGQAPGQNATNQNAGLTGDQTEILRRPWMRAITLLGELAAKEFLQPVMRRSEQVSA